MARGPKTFDYKDGKLIASSKRKPFDPNDPKDIKKEILPDGTVRWVEKNVHPTRT